MLIYAQCTGEDLNKYHREQQDMVNWNPTMYNQHNINGQDEQGNMSIANAKEEHEFCGTYH
jgi:hypothetical protein